MPHWDHHRRACRHLRTGLTAAAFAGALSWGVGGSAAATEGASPGAGADEVPTVSVAPVARRDLFREVTIQGEFRAYQEVELHAMVQGYLRSVPVDFGDRVKAGQEIATLEIPELNSELDQAAAAQRRAEAGARSAALDYNRLLDASRSRPGLVAQQDLDTALAKSQETAAAAEAAAADVGKFRTLVGYTHVTAPFDGVVTARYADPGALIQSGATSQAIVRISENQRLRLDFPVSVTYAAEVAVGDRVTVSVEGGRSFELPITRFSRRIAMDTRTMDTEVEVPNPDLRLIPGMYATVTLRIGRRPGTLSIPVEAVSGASRPSVFVVGPDDRIVERSVVLGVESPAWYEVVSGVSEGERVVIGGRAAVRPGDRVRIASATKSSR